MRVGCVIVSYDVPEIISRAVNSIKGHVDEVIVIDNSSPRNPAYREADTLGVTVLHTGRNIGHGPGMDMGINKLNTEFVIVMDSDTVVKDPSIIDDMKKLMADDVYGVGRVIQRMGVDYLHPYFAMIRKEYYLRHKPFINHGAPCCEAMADIKDKLKVIGIDMGKVWHEHRRTRERKRI